MTLDLRTALASRVVVADGGMGTMLQSFNLGPADFSGLEGCNEILNVNRPDVVAAIHRSYFEAGSDCVETNTFGANLSALAEYDVADRIAELAEAGARIARRVADELSTPGRPRWVLGSMGPGTKLPTLGHISFTELRDAYQTQAAALIKGGVDGIIIETCQDLLQAKAAVIGARRAQRDAGTSLPVIVSVTVETSGTMLVGTEIGAALATLEPLGIDVIGLNCATGPLEMGEHLRQLARHARIGLSCMPNAGLPELTPAGAYYPLTPEGLVNALDEYVREYGLCLVGGCCGTTPAHIRLLADTVGGRPITPRTPEVVPAVASLYSEVALRQETSYLSIGERTNANGSRAFREAMLAGQWDACLDIARTQSHDGAHILDVCVDYVGRDGVADMRELASRLATTTTLPIMLDSTDPEVIRAGLELLPGRSVINSVNFEDGAGPGSRFQEMMTLAAEYGAAVVALTIDEEGQARTAEHKVRVAERLIDSITGTWGMQESDIIVDCLTFPIATGQEETRGDARETIRAIRTVKQRHPHVLTTLGVSNVSFGLNPAARIVLNSVFLHECVAAGLDSAIVHTARIVPMSQIPTAQRDVALDLVYDRRVGDYDPLDRFLEMFAGVTTTSTRQARAMALAALPLDQRLARRIIDGDAKGLEADLDSALAVKEPLAIINEDLLSGMKTVGDLFGAGQMQLPFVLQSAEVMKAAVSYLEPHLASSDNRGKGTIVLATVKGDVHDIGKNLVDIILTNNGYKVVNVGIKQPIQTIIAAAEEHRADVIGMSGLLVKSTAVMRDNLLELNARGLSHYPVLLGGAALTRAYVEHDLNNVYEGEVRYARDAFEGLTLMDAIMSVKREVPGAALPAPHRRRVQVRSGPDQPPVGDVMRSDVARGGPVPVPPFLGSRIARGIKLADVGYWLDQRALFAGQWGLRSTPNGPSYDELVQTDGLPRLRRLLDHIQTAQLADFAVVYGYWPCYSDGNQVVVLNTDESRDELCRFTFPRQPRGRRLCIADYFRDKAEAASSGPDVIGLQLVTMGGAIATETRRLFEADAYRDYLELHGLGVQLTEALAEMWHARVRRELHLEADGAVEDVIKSQAYQGLRYSFGYSSCPDLAERHKLVALLEPERIGVTLSETLQLHPEESTDALIIHHPEATYFNAQ